MRPQLPKAIEKYRETDGPMQSTKAMGLNGLFHIPFKTMQDRTILRVVSSDGLGWLDCGMKLPAFEHVSVSLNSRCPTWEEMDFIKRIFWRDTETVMQLHVPRKYHKNVHPYCLHLWRPLGVEIPLPDVLVV